MVAVILTQRVSINNKLLPRAYPKCLPKVVVNFDFSWVYYHADTSGMPMNSAQWLFSASLKYSLIFKLEETKDFQKSNLCFNTYLDGYHEKENSSISAWWFSFPGRLQCGARPFFILNGMGIFETVMKRVASAGAICFLLFAKHYRLHLH